MREQKVEEPSRTSSLPIKGSHLTIRLHSCIHSLVVRYLALLTSRLGFLRYRAWGFDLSLAGPWRLGVALDDGRLVSPHPAVLILACHWGFDPWFMFFLSVTNLGELLLSTVLTSCDWLVLGPRACHSLGVAFLSISLDVYNPHLQFGSVSLRSDLGF